MDSGASAELLCIRDLRLFSVTADALASYRKLGNDIATMLERSGTVDSSTDYDNLSTSTFTDNDDFDCLNMQHSRQHRRQHRPLQSQLRLQQQQQQQQQLCDQCSSECRCANATPTNADMNDQLSSTVHGSQTMTVANDMLKIRPARQTRSYRIIDNNESQRILQQIANEKMAEMEIAKKTSKTNRKKLSAMKSTQSLLLHKQDNTQQLWKSENDFTNIALSSKRHTEVTRAASFGHSTLHGLHKQWAHSKISLPINIVPFAAAKKDERDTISDLNLEHVEMTTTVRETLPLTVNRSHVPDDDVGSMQRLSFVSSSTGYSSARSSLRSSEIGEESFLSKTSEAGIERRIISQESLLSEARRLKLMKKSSISQFDRIAMELLETERCYVNDLSDIIQGYLNFFIGHREQFQMTVDDVSNTFGCIERIYLFNKRLFCQLDRTLLNVVQMAKCFVDNIDGFKDYVTYCANYQKMVDTLANLMKNPSIVECLSARQAMLGHSLPLSAYLLKPVQRVLKYHLFMENILKQSTETRVLSDADLATVRKALQCLTCLADKINEEKKRVEHWERVRELQSALHSWSLDKRDDLFKYGDLLLEGTFKMAGSKTNRQLFLFEEMLLIVKERNNVLICKDYIMCSSIMLNESIGQDPLSFQVMSYDNPKIQYVFIATNLEQKRKWMKELKRMMLDHYDVKIPEKAKLLMINTDNVSAKQPISGVSVHETTQNYRSRKVPKYLEKKRKHRDTSTPKTNLHRSRRIHASKSGSFGSKPSSSESVVSCPGLELNNSHISSKCICGINGLQRSNFVGKQCLSASTHLDHPYCTSTSFFSNFFQRKRSVEHANSLGSTDKCGIPLHDQIVLPHSSLEFSSKAQDGKLLRCTCSKLEPVVSPISFSEKVSTSHDDNPDGDSCSFVRAYQKLNDSLSRRGVTEKSLEKNLFRNHRLSLLERSLLGKHSKKLEERNCGTDNEDEYDTDTSNDDQRCRSKSLSRLDDSCPSPKIPLPASNMAQYPFSDERESNLSINTEKLGNYLNRVCQNNLQESDRDEDEEEEIPNSISWTESPVTREKMKSRINSSQNTHRRHSSQVAELVWRIKQKQDLKNAQNRNEVLQKSSNVTQNHLPPSEIKNESFNDIQLLHLKDRLNEKSVNTNSLISSARQRTPLTVEQQAQLNDMLLEPQLGVVKEMIKQLETQPRSAFRVL